VPVRLDQHASGENSQHGEAGMIDAVFREIGARTRTCVEFGAYDLERFSNVAPLWRSGWQALLIEGNREYYEKIRRQYEAHPSRGKDGVRVVNRFVAASGPDSLDSILEEHGMPADPDLVSIDVDGLDYHIWRGLTKHRPRLVIIEYNATIPAHLDIVGSAEGNNIGSSALAMARLGAEKGYTLIGCIGWNAFFVERAHAHRFADADDLEALFDDSSVRYAMQSTRGQVFFSGPLAVPYNPFFRRDSAAIERSSVPVGTLGDTVPRVAEGAARWIMRALRSWYRRARGDR
jgi:hypothetical protein